MDKRKDVVTMGGNPVTLIGNEIKVGVQGPDFTVLTNDMEPFSLQDAGKKVKIISVVPSLDTGVCEFQTTHFNEKASELGDVAILTVSVDLPFAQKRFCGAKGIDQVVTLSDHKDLSFGLNYGFVIEELRLLSRGIVILDKNNIVQYVEYVKEVKEHPNYERALEEAKKLV
ncbi:thiol peroxidase [Alkaliphilus metalliredigens]|nr:thiol peroxidase [Alkaliphilus metalliredigens]